MRKQRGKISFVLLVVLVASFFARTYAAQIKAQNVSWNGSDYDYFSAPILYMITGQDFFERFVNPGEDIGWIEGMTNPNLTIWSQEPNDPNKIATSRKPPQTPGWEVYLGVKGSIAGPISNDIEVLVQNADGLEHRKLIAYDSNNPGTVYELDKTNWNIIPLPNLQNKQDEVYAIWIIATPPNLPGDIAYPNGVGELDGVVNIYDLKVIADEWLNETLVGENYDWSDVDYDRLTRLCLKTMDFADTSYIRQGDRPYETTRN